MNIKQIGITGSKGFIGGHLLDKLPKEIPNSKLLIIGDGPEKNKLIELVSGLNLERDVLFLSTPNLSIRNFLLEFFPNYLLSIYQIFLVFLSNQVVRILFQQLPLYEDVYVFYHGLRPDIENGNSYENSHNKNCK